MRGQIGAAAVDNLRASLQNRQQNNHYEQKHWMEPDGQDLSHGDASSRVDGGSQPHGGRDSTLAFPNTFFSTYHDPPFDGYAAESWLPEAIPAWGQPVENNVPWSHSNLLASNMMSRQYERQQQPAMIYTNFETPYNFSGLQSPPISAGYELSTANNESYRNPIQRSNEIHQNEGNTYQSHTPQTSYHQQSPVSPVDGMSCFQLQTNNYMDSNDYGGEFIQEQHISTWSTAAGDLSPQNNNINTAGQYPISPESSSPGPHFGWTIHRPESPESAISSRPPSFLPGESVFTVAVPTPKRRAGNGLEMKSQKSDTAQKDISDCVDVFENEPGALKSVKRRKKLDAPVRKAAREVRKAGACHQCKFRKRTVSIPILFCKRKLIYNSAQLGHHVDPV